MKSYEKYRQKNTYDLILLMKLLSLFFVCMMIYHKSNAITVFHQQNYGYFDVIPLGICTILIIFVYYMWYRSVQLRHINDRLKLFDIIEIMIFMSIFSSLIIMSGSYLSSLKFLFLFIIIPSAIQFGLVSGLIVAVLSSIIILLIDYFAFSYSTVNQFFESDLILVGIFILTACLLGYYVKQEKEYKEYLLRLADMDDLTEVYKHRFFQDELTKKFQIAQNSHQPLSLVFVDIDYFKYYNDINGHQSGDAALKKIANIFKTCLRPNDILARYGGEEFAILLPNTDEKQAAQIAEEIRSEVEKEPFYGEENQPNGKLTVSAGVSCYPNRAMTKKDLINSADEALNKAKLFNRNRVEIYSSLLQELKDDIGDEHIDLVSSIKTLISIINAKDRYTYGHVERVVIFCQLISEYLGLDEHEQKILRYGAYLHDIGKIEVSKEILNKKMPLTKEEWDVLKKHPENGVIILKQVEALKEVLPVILHHHERYDGTGYPNGLKGEEIPYLARILSVADSFDTMTSNRPYKLRMNYDEAIAEIQKCSNYQFDPEIVKAFTEVVRLNKESFHKLK